MPISAMGGDYTEEHWSDVREIIADALWRTEPRFNVRLASDADVPGSIQATITTSLRDAPMAVCDVSGRNANAVLELGLRLGQNKPVVIVKDNQTDYVSNIRDLEYIEYRLDCGYRTIRDFQERLAEKVVATYLASLKPRKVSRAKVARAPVTPPLSRSPVVDKAPPPVKADVQRELEVMAHRLSLLEQSLRSGAAAGTDFLSNAVVRYIEQENIDDPPSLAGNSDFWHYLFSQHPLRYFRTPKEFRETTRDLLKSLTPQTSH